MKSLILFTKLILLSSWIPVVAQTGALDYRVPYGNETARGYSLYVPEDYQTLENVPLVVGFHPYSSMRWNSKTWRDSLISFAEINGVMLLCPDGGYNGRTDDPEDFQFTIDLISRLLYQYRIDPQRIFTLGYSRGATAAIKFSMENPNLVQGMLLVGMASDQIISELGAGLASLRNVRCYLIHGQWDAPYLRFHPLREALMRAGVCLEFQLLTGVGHTFDFSARNEILSQGFSWLNQAKCFALPPHETALQRMQAQYEGLTVYPNPGYENQYIWVSGIKAQQVQQIKIYRRNGILSRIINDFHPDLPISGLAKGEYYFVFLMEDQIQISRQVWIQ